MTDLSDRLRTAKPWPILGRHPDFPLPTLKWPGEDKPTSWWGRGPNGELTKVFRDYGAYSDD